MISRSASYAIRALTWIAATSPEGWVLNREIAEALELPPQFLTKILRTLAEQRLLLSQRGKTGGFSLARPAERISLIEIVDPFDHLTLPRQCILGQVLCRDERPCPLHEEWKQMSERLVENLRSMTLADMAAGVRADGFPRIGTKGSTTGKTGRDHV